MTDTKQLEQKLEQLSTEHINLVSSLKAFIDKRKFTKAEGNMLMLIEANKCLTELEEILRTTVNTEL